MKKALCIIVSYASLRVSIEYLFLLKLLLQSGYTNQYHHAECYRNRKDLTKLWGFRDLTKEDQKRFMTEEQRRQCFPGDYAAAASSSSGGGLEKRDANVAKCTEQEQLAKKQKNDKDDAAAKKRKEREIAEAKRLAEEERQRTLAAEKAERQRQLEEEKRRQEEEERQLRLRDDVFSITGLKYGEANAVCGEKVTLLREPENQYDANAVKVVNGYRQLIGRIEKEKAATLSPQMKKMQEDFQSQHCKLFAEGTIVSVGDDYQQLVKVEFKKIPTKSSTTVINPYAKSAK